MIWIIELSRLKISSNFSHNVFFFLSIGQKKWRVKFEELKLYKKIHGHCMVSMLDKENRSLATWVSNQRTQYRNRLENKKASINQQRIELLNEMCFQWNVHARSKKNERNKENISSSTNEIAQSAWAKGKNKMNWMKMFDRLCEYKKIYGNTNVQKKHDGKLKNWVSSSRMIQFGKDRYN